MHLFILFPLFHTYLDTQKMTSHKRVALDYKRVANGQEKKPILSNRPTKSKYRCKKVTQTAHLWLSDVKNVTQFHLIHFTLVSVLGMMFVIGWVEKKESERDDG